MAFFPFMIQMQDKLCVIGGGGKVAYRKVSMMVSFGEIGRASCRERV